MKNLLEGWDHRAMGGDEVITQAPNLVQREFGSGMWIERCCMIDVLALAGEGCFDGHRLYVDVGLHHGCQMWRQVADFGWLQAALVDQDGDFDAATLGKVVDQPAVGDIAVYDTGLAGLHTVDDK